MSINKKEVKVVNENITCDRCKKPIEDLCYIRVTGSLILREYMPQIPQIFKCQEHANNYAKYLTLHDDCWIAMLKEYGIKLVDMKELAEKKEKEIK